MRLSLFALAAASLVVAGPVAAANLIPAHTSSVASDGVTGVLRAGSPWGPGSTASDLNAPVDGVLAPEFQQWNNGSYWWDEDPSVNSTTPVHYTIQLDGLFTFGHFLMQADDNDSYRVEAWDGAAWQNVWDVPTLPSFGLRVRESGTLAPVTTDRFRLTATGGDNYYAISEFRAFSVPEPGAWALMIAGFGLVGAALRRRAVPA
jgi:hypothetical protein